MWWNKKPEIKPVTKSAEGFFSTDKKFEAASTGDMQKNLEKSIQRTPDDFTIVKDGLAVAMDDSAYSGIKETFRGWGTNISYLQASWYSSQGFIGFQMCAIISQHWLVDKIISIPARDAVRNWFEIKSADKSTIKPEIIDRMNEIDKEMNLADNLVQFVRKGKIFGIRLALFVVDNGGSSDEYYANPFNVDAVKPGAYKGIVQLDPYWISPELTTTANFDPTSLDFYEPTWWNVQGKRIHKSHLCIFRNGELPDLLKPTYLYGSVSLPQQLYERVYAAERTANEAPLLAMTKRTTAIHLDVAQALANPASFKERIAQWVALRDNEGIRILGKEEIMEQFDTALNDFDSLITNQYEICCAIGRVPITKVMGRQSKGMNATGEGDEANYHEELKSIQKHDLTPLVDRHRLLVSKSIIFPEFGIEPKVIHSWNPLDERTDKEIAELNNLNANTASILIENGTISGEEDRDRLKNDPDSGYNSLAGPAPEPEPETDETKNPVKPDEKFNDKDA